MSKHRTHQMHDNSIRAWRSFPMGTRKRLVCEIIEKYGAMTDRQICNKHGSQDMNSCRPSITTLVNDGVLVEVNRINCSVTGCLVRVVDFPDRWAL